MSVKAAKHAIRAKQMIAVALAIVAKHATLHAIAVKAVKLKIHVEQAAILAKAVT